MQVMNYMQRLLQLISRLDRLATASAGSVRWALDPTRFFGAWLNAN